MSRLRMIMRMRFGSWAVAGIGLTGVLICAGCGGDDDAQGSARTAAPTLWFVSVAGERRGPFEEVELRGDVASMRTPADALVWHDGLGDWLPVDQAFPGVVDAEARTQAHASRRVFLDLCGRGRSLLRGGWKTWQPIHDFEKNPGPATAAAARRSLDGQARLLDDARQRWAVIVPIDIDYSRGWSLILEHTLGITQISSLLSADARVCLSTSDTATAVGDVVAIARISQQLVTDESATSSLVSLAIVRDIEHHVLPGLSTAALSDAERDRLRAAMRWLEAPDPFRIGPTVRRERQHVAESVQRDLEQIRDHGETVSGQTPGDRSTTLRRYLGDEAFDALLATEDLDHEVDRCRDAYDALLVLLGSSAKPASVDVTALEQRIASGEYGQLAAALLPRRLRFVKEIHEQRSTVDAVLAYVR